MVHFDKPTYTVRKTRKKEIPKGVYTKDPATGEIVFNKEVEDNQMVVPKSGHHFPLGARARIAKLFDEGTFHETHASVKSSDPLGFVDSQSYTARIKRYEKDSGLPAAVICSDAFVATADAMASLRGAPGYRYLTTPHPVAILAPDQVRERAAQLAAAVVELLTA